MEKADDKSRLKITVRLAGLELPISIVREDEEKYRRAEVVVNRMVANYKNAFRSDLLNYFAMAALHAGVENVEYRMADIETNTVEKLHDLEKQLDQYIGEIKS